MLLNLSKSFHFDRDQKEYHIHYIFTKEFLEGSNASDICLEVSVAVGNSKIRSKKLSKPISTLRLSNEEIEKIIEEEAISF
jgi:hypothetical protein